MEYYFTVAVRYKVNERAKIILYLRYNIDNTRLSISFCAKRILILRRLQRSNLSWSKGKREGLYSFLQLRIRTVRTVRIVTVSKLFLRQL